MLAMLAGCLFVCETVQAAKKQQAAYLAQKDFGQKHEAVYVLLEQQEPLLAAAFLQATEWMASRNRATRTEKKEMGAFLSLVNKSSLRKDDKRAVRSFIHCATGKWSEGKIAGVTLGALVAASVFSCILASQIRGTDIPKGTSGVTFPALTPSASGTAKRLLGTVNGSGEGAGILRVGGATDLALAPPASGAARASLEYVDGAGEGAGVTSPSLAPSASGPARASLEHMDGACSSLEGGSSLGVSASPVTDHFAGGGSSGSVLPTGLHADGSRACVSKWATSMLEELRLRPFAPILSDINYDFMRKLFEINIHLGELYLSDSILFSFPGDYSNQGALAMIFLNALAGVSCDLQDVFYVSYQKKTQLFSRNDSVYFCYLKTKSKFFLCKYHGHHMPMFLEEMSSFDESSFLEQRPPNLYSFNKSQLDQAFSEVQKVALPPDFHAYRKLRDDLLPRLLKAEEISFPVSIEGLSVSQICGERDQMEDTLAVKREPDFFGAAVFDGHGGDQVANTCRDTLLQRLADVKDRLSNDGEIQRVIIDFDMYLHSALSDCDNVGSTGVLFLKVGGQYKLVNLGDSRGIVLDSEGGVIVATSDHKPLLSSEKTRIEQCGGSVTHLDQAGRINNGLSMSRAFGDFSYKKQAVKSSDNLLLYQLSNIPEIITLSDAQRARARYIVLASDGLFDTPRPMGLAAFSENMDHAYTDFCGQQNNAVGLKLKSFIDDLKPFQYSARALVANAFRGHSRDNITVVVIDLAMIGDA